MKTIKWLEQWTHNKKVVNFAGSVTTFVHRYVFDSSALKAYVTFAKSICLLRDLNYYMFIERSDIDAISCCRFWQYIPCSSLIGWARQITKINYTKLHIFLLRIFLV